MTNTTNAAMTDTQRKNLLSHADDMDACGWKDDAKALRDLLVAQPQAAEAVEMALCSTEQVFLKPNQLYRFYVKDGCEACARIANPPASPVAQAQEGDAVPENCDVRKILLRVVPGDGDGLEIYAKNVADVEKLLSEMGERIENYELEATHEDRRTAHRDARQVLEAVGEQFERFGNSMPDGFDARVFRWVKDALAAPASTADATRSVRGKTNE